MSKSGRRPGERCATGGAVITPGGGRLCVRHVVHAVGPNYAVRRDNGACDALLASAYCAAMARAAEADSATIGFSLLSAGIFRGGRSLEAVLRIAVDAVAGAAYEGLGEAGWREPV